MSNNASSATFYRDLKSFSDFSGVADKDHYSAAPHDWFVIIADIQGSTRAISEGRYKDVNMIGAACINAVLNISQHGEIPFVFGGDGATMLTPAHRMQACRSALLNLQHMARSAFNLELRVGIVPVADINQQAGHEILVGKYQISAHNVLATFSGGGVDLAERWIKSDSSYLVKESNAVTSPDLHGLSCRWEPLASKNGVMLSILIQVNLDDASEKSKLYSHLIHTIGNITDNNPDAGKPVSTANLKMRWPPGGLKAEINATVGHGNRFLWSFRIYVFSLFQWLLNYFNLSFGPYHAKQYRVELQHNTDYRRFDDNLRLLLDCSTEQADKIDVLLSEYRRRGQLHYGLHKSDSALMTCLVFNLEAGEHIHFVDGEDGGFTTAAKNMKTARLDSPTTTPPGKQQHD